MAAAVERRGEQPRGAPPGGRPLQRRTEAAVLRARRLHDRAAPVGPRHLARLFLAVLLDRRDSPRLGGARRVRVRVDLRDPAAHLRRYLGVRLAARHATWHRYTA